MEESKRVETAKIEIVVVKWNIRTLAVKGKNDLDQAETLLLQAQTLRCDILYCRRSDGVNRGRLRQLGILYISVVRRRVGTTGVGLAVAERIVEASGTCTPKPFNERLLNVQLSLTGK